MRSISIIFALILLTSCAAMNGLLKNPSAIELIVDGEELLEKELEQPKKIDHSVPLMVCGTGFLIAALSVAIWKFIECSQMKKEIKQA